MASRPYLPHPSIPSSHSVPADYGELFTGRPPDIIFSHDDNDSLLSSPTYGEPDYLDEEHDPVQSTKDDISQEAPVDVVYRDSEGHTKLDSSGNPIMISGLHPDALQGISFLTRETDGTRRRARVIKQNKDGNKDIAAHKKFIIQYEQDDIDDIMSYNNIMNFIHRD